VTRCPISFSFVRRRSAWVLGLSLGLLACATPMPQVDANSADMLSGRLSVVVSGPQASPSAEGQPTATQSLSAAFELRGSAQAGSLDLISPLGSIMARAVWSPAGAHLQSNRGSQRYDDIASLTRDMLGESLPVEALFDWLRGRPWAGAPSSKNVAPLPEGFSQMGWRVDLSRFAQAVIVAERERAPKVLLRARLDPP
jgi:outer membrane lipoprotein LolB